MKISVYYKLISGRDSKDGERNNATEFKYLSAENYLAAYPKFGGLSAEAERFAISEDMR